MSRRTGRIAAPLLGASLALTLLLPGVAHPQERSSSAAVTVTVQMKFSNGKYVFSQKTVNIKKYDTIKWKNVTNTTHTTTRQTTPVTWNATVAPFKSWSRAFGRTGQFAYSCTKHPGMTGTINVT